MADSQLSIALAKLDEKDAKIAQLRETIAVLEENMRHIATRMEPSKDELPIILRRAIESLKDTCSSKTSKIIDLRQAIGKLDAEVQELKRRNGAAAIREAKLNAKVMRLQDKPC